MVQHAMKKRSSKWAAATMDLGFLLRFFFFFLTSTSFKLCDLFALLSAVPFLTLPYQVLVKFLFWFGVWWKPKILICYCSW